MKKIMIAMMILIVSVAFIGCKKEASGYEKGILTDTTFESKYLGIRFSIPEGLVMGTEEDLNRMMDIGAEITGTSKLQIDYAKLTTIYEMMAMDPSGKSNILICVEKPVLSNLSVEQYLSALKDGLLAQEVLGYTLAGDTVSVNLMEQDYEKMTFLLSNVGCHQSYLVRKIDGRFLSIVITYFEEEQLENLMNGFSAY